MREQGLPMLAPGNEKLHRAGYHVYAEPHRRIPLQDHDGLKVEGSTTERPGNDSLF